MKIVFAGAKAITESEYKALLKREVKAYGFKSVEEARDADYDSIFFDSVEEYLDWRKEQVENKNLDKVKYSDEVEKLMKTNNEDGLNLRDALAQCLESLWNEQANPNIEIAVFNMETDEMAFGKYGALSYTHSQMSQWDYSNEDWDSMDFEILAEELLNTWEYEEKIFEVRPL